MKIIGITGGTGSGKTTVLTYLESLGARIIDCDVLYHSMLSSCSEMIAEIEECFPGVLKEGKLDTKELGAVVFNNPEGLEALNRITHEYIRREVRSIITEEKNTGRDVVAIDAILLLESGIGDYCSRVIGVISSPEIRLKRIMVRDGISEEYAISRINAQKNNDFYIDNCDVILENNGDDRENFYAECSILINSMLQEISQEEEY